MSIEEVNHKDSTYKKYSNYFKQKEIGNFIDSFLEQNVDKIIKDLNESYEKAT